MCHYLGIVLKQKECSTCISCILYHLFAVRSINLNIQAKHFGSLSILNSADFYSGELWNHLICLLTFSWLIFRCGWVNIVLFLEQKEAQMLVDQKKPENDGQKINSLVLKVPASDLSKCLPMLKWFELISLNSCSMWLPHPWKKTWRFISNHFVQII